MEANIRIVAYLLLHFGLLDGEGSLEGGAGVLLGKGVAGEVIH